MSLDDQTNLIVSISLFLKLLFICFIAYELLLHCLKKVKLIESWHSSFQTEMQTWLMEAGTFIIAIGFLLGLDFMSASESWLSLEIILLIDLILIVAILFFLFSPKHYGITSDGLYVNGRVIPWKRIQNAKLIKKHMDLKMKGAFREKLRIPLPEEDEKKKILLDYLKTNVRIGD